MSTLEGRRDQIHKYGGDVGISWRENKPFRLQDSSSPEEATQAIERRLDLSRSGSGSFNKEDTLSAIRIVIPIDEEIVSSDIMRSLVTFVCSNA
jgi:hypothetical protein